MTADLDRPKASKQLERERRRAAALGENLRRRKAQARDRAAGESGDLPAMSPDPAGQGSKRETEP